MPSISPVSPVPSVSAPAGSAVTLGWANPTTRSGSPPAALNPGDIANIILSDAIGGAPSQQIAKLAGTATSFTTNALAAGVHTFTGVAVDNGGNQSTPFIIAQATITAAPPSPLTNGTISVG
jgi:hypothetical protein